VIAFFVGCHQAQALSLVTVTQGTRVQKFPLGAKKRDGI